MNTLYKKMNRGAVVVSLVLALILTVTPMLTGKPTYAEGGDKGDLLKPFTVTLEGMDEPLHHGFPAYIRVDFPVPVKGDGLNEGSYIEKGDVVTLTLSDSFRFDETSPDYPKTYDLVHDQIPVGRVELQNSGDNPKIAVAYITFDGDDVVFNGEKREVSGWFSAELEYNGADVDESGDAHKVTILDQEFSFYAPGDTINYKVEKTGNITGDEIRWQVEIKAESDTLPDPTPIDLKGYVFKDNLKYVGAFVEGSFEVDGTPVTGFTYAGDLLEYEFPENSISPQTIEFKTTIAASILANGGSVTNTAGLSKDELELENDSETKTIESPTFTKYGVTGESGATYDPENQTLTWYIIVDTKGRELPGLTIKDPLLGNLTFKEAIWQTYKGPDHVTEAGLKNDANWENSSPSWDSLPENDDYSIGNFTGYGRLKIVTEVPAPAGVVVGVTSYGNQAAATWGGGGSGGTGPAYKGVGYDAMTKSGSYNAATKEITWTVMTDLKGQQSANGIVVYDLIVPDKTIENSALQAASGWPLDGNDNPLPLPINSPEQAGIVRNSGQELIADSLNPQPNGTTQPRTQLIELKDNDGKTLGILIKIDDLSSTGNNEVTFKTKVVDPAILTGNGANKAVPNTAVLYEGSKWRRLAKDSVDIRNRVMAKDMLHRNQVAIDHTQGIAAIDPTERTSNAANGFNHIYKEVIFRLNVNASGVNFNDDGTLLGTGGFGDVTVTDTLPAGWEFVPFEDGPDGPDGPMFLLYKTAGPVADNSHLTPVMPHLENNSLPTGFDPSFEEDTPGTISFTFESLSIPYVILVKARLTEAKLEEALQANKVSTYENKVVLETQNGGIKKEDKQTVNVNTRVLDKALHNQEKAYSDGYIEWKIDYTPYDKDAGVWLEDKLPEGLDLRTDSHGQLIFESGGKRNINILLLTMNADGSYSQGDELPLDEVKAAISYDADDRILKFTFPDGEKAYRLIYVTDITGEPGSPLKNTVKIYGGLVAGASDDKVFSIQSGQAGATMKNSASLTLRKTKSDGVSALAGATFVLYNTKVEPAGEQGSKRAEKTTGTNGEITFYGLVPGTYILIEEVAPEGYPDNPTVYEVIVDEDYQVTIDGRVIDTQHPLTVRNFKSDELLGDLTLKKLVEGNAGDPDAEFTFIIYLFPKPEITIASNLFGNNGVNAAVFDYVGLGGAPNGTISSGGQVRLKGGQSIAIFDLPDGMSYLIEEVEANQNGYITTSVGEEGVITDTAQSNAVFTNSKTLGELSIAKTVEGNAGDLSKKFSFQVHFFEDDEVELEGEFEYEGFGVADGTISSGDEIELAHGQWIVIKGLPLGSTYEVIEVEANENGYITESVDETGGFTLEDFRQYARFVNTKNLGELTIKKIVNGISGDKTRKFTFEVTLTDAEGREVEGKFAYKGTGVADGEIASGGTVKLADGESIVIQGLPLGSTYEVLELEADEDDYITTAIGDTGKFTLEKFEQSSQFTNTRNVDLEGEGDEKDKDKDKDNEIPKTGDTTNYVWLAIFIASLTLLILLKGADTYLKRRRSTR